MRFLTAIFLSLLVSTFELFGRFLMACSMTAQAETPRSR